LAVQKEEELSFRAKPRRGFSVFWWICAAATASAAVLLLLILQPRKNNFDRFCQPVLETSSSPVLSLPTTDTFQPHPEATQAFGQLKPGDSVKLGLGDVQTFHNWHVSLPVLQATLLVALALERKGKTPLVRMGRYLLLSEADVHRAAQMVRNLSHVPLSY
jgi:hypothetical protein